MKFLNYSVLINIFILLVTSNCNLEQKRIVKDYYGKELIISGSVTTISEDSLISTHDYKLNKDIKIFSYLQGDCIPCASVFEDWKKFIYELNTKDEDVKLFFFVESKDMKFTKNIFDQYDLNATLIFGDQGKNLSFTFPEGQVYQTFLLNQNDEIVLVGTPLYHNSIKELYIEQIQLLTKSRD